MLPLLGKLKANLVISNKNLFRKRCFNCTRDNQVPLAGSAESSASSAPSPISNEQNEEIEKKG